MDSNVPLTVSWRALRVPVNGIVDVHHIDSLAFGRKPHVYGTTAVVRWQARPALPHPFPATIRFFRFIIFSRIAFSSTVLDAV